MKKYLILFISFLATVQVIAQCEVCPSQTKTLTASSGDGVAPFTFAWSNAATTAAITVGVGTYTVTVTDANGCTATATETVTEFTPPAVALVPTNGTCGALGSIDATPSSGQSPYTYLWSNGATTQDITGLSDGTYTITVTDNNMCTATASATITNTTSITATISCN